jgi:hypothetical protein
LPTSRFYYRKDPAPDVQDPQNKDTEDDNAPYLDDFSGVWAKNKPGLWDNAKVKIIDLPNSVKRIAPRQNNGQN